MGECICCSQEASERNPNPVFALRQCHFSLSWMSSWTRSVQQNFKNVSANVSTETGFWGLKTGSWIHRHTPLLSWFNCRNAVMVCVCVQAVGGCRDHGAPAVHVHRLGFHINFQHRAWGSATVPVWGLQTIQQHPFPQLQTLLLCYPDGQCVCVCLSGVSSGKTLKASLTAAIMGSCDLVRPFMAACWRSFPVASRVKSPENCCCSNLLLTRWSIVSPSFLLRCTAWSGWLTWGVRWTASTCSSCWPLPSVMTLTTQDTTTPIR